LDPVQSIQGYILYIWIACQGSLSSWNGLHG